MHNSIKFIAVLFLLHLSLVSLSQSKVYKQAISKLDKRGEVYVKIYSNPNLDRSILNKISVDKVEYDFVKAYLNLKTLNLIENRGLKYEVLQSAGELFKETQSSKSYNYNEYPTYAQYDSLMHSFELNYPDLCKLHSIGTLNSGREIFVMKISDSVNVNKNKPQFLYTSSMHGDELVGYVLMLRLIDYLLSNHSQDSLVSHLMKNVEIYINPLANPNGAYYNSNNSVSGATRFNLNGIDINRNFPDPRNGPHPDGNAWQEETSIFMGFADTMDFVLSANIHGGVEVFNYPWDTWSRRVADDLWWQYQGRAYVDTVHKYSPADYFIAFNNGITNGYDWYVITGGRQDYMNYFHKCREMTLEISDVKLPLENTLDGFWQYNYKSLLNYINSITLGLKGAVSDSATAKPIKARVRILNYDKDSSFVYSNSNSGLFHRMLVSGYYKLEFSSVNYKTEVFDSVYVKSDSLTILNVQLAKGPSSIKDIDLVQMEVYPNPFENEIKIELKSDFSEYRISVFDVNSRLIDVIDLKNQKNFELKGENYKPGVYLLLITSGEKLLIRKKIIKI